MKTTFYKNPPPPPPPRLHLNRPIGYKAHPKSTHQTCKKRCTTGSGEAMTSKRSIGVPSSSSKCSLGLKMKVTTKKTSKFKNVQYSLIQNAVKNKISKHRVQISTFYQTANKRDAIRTIFARKRKPHDSMYQKIITPILSFLKKIGRYCPN